MPSTKSFVRPEYGALFFFDESRFESAITKHRSISQSAKRALDAADEHLRTRYLEGEDIHKLVKDRSDFIDRLLYYLWVQCEWDECIALFAVGGYGRGEMHPHSDIDLLVLYDGDSPGIYAAKLEQFFTSLWDLGLKIGHSVRNIDQCTEAAKDDLATMTNLMERRLITGVHGLDKELDQFLDRVWPAKEFFKGKFKEQQTRHNKHGITEFDLEPNVKESPGGLRDIQTIQWVAKCTYRVSGLEQLAGKGLYQEEEYYAIKAAESFLWRVRFGLHSMSTRPREQLDFESQRQLAEELGYKDNKQGLAVDQFMQDYYRAASVVREITDVLMQVLDEELNPSKHRVTTPINDRFQSRGGYIEMRYPEVFLKHPSALIEIFVLLARHPELYGIQGETIRQIRINSNLIDQEFRERPKHKELFVKLIKSHSNLSVPLQKMSRYSVLGRYLPEFGRIKGLSQHDLFHIYPVDIHTLAVVKNIVDFGNLDARKDFPVSSYAYASLSKPEVLIIAGLFHDIGKGRGGDHSELGSIDAYNFAIEHAFTPREARLIAWLVANHLFMSRVAQREDVSDPEVIARFANHVGDENRLNLLYSLTTADILATNPTLWNNWRASLMRQLYNNALRHLRQDSNAVLDTIELVIETKNETLQKIKHRNLDTQQVETIWSELSDDYFIRETAEDISWHAELLLASKADTHATIEIKPFMHYQRERATVVFIKSNKKEKLFLSAATVAAQVGLSIQDARIYSTEQFQILTLYLLDENARPFSSNLQRTNRLKKALLSSLNGKKSKKLMPRTPRRLKSFPVRTQVKLSSKETESILEVTAADRPGLLGTIAEILLEHEIRLKGARIATLGERVEDLFMVENSHGGAINDHTKVSALVKSLETKIDALATS